MTNVRRLSWRKVGGAAFVAAALVIVACETPRPDPVAPIAIEKEVPGSTNQTAEFRAQLARCGRAGGNGCAMAVIVRSSAGTELKRYEGEIPVEIADKYVQNVNVENAKCGTSECSLIWITLKPEAAFEVPRQALTRSELVELRRDATEPKKGANGEPEYLEVRAVPLKLDSSLHRVLDESRELVEKVKKLSATVTGTTLISDGIREESGTGAISLPPKVLLRSGNALSTQIVNRSGDSKTISPLVVVDGVILTGSVDNIAPQSIEKIEVVKGSAATRMYGDRAKDGVIQITTKRSRVP